MLEHAVKPQTKQSDRNSVNFILSLGVERLQIGKERCEIAGSQLIRESFGHDGKRCG